MLAWRNNSYNRISTITNITALSIDICIILLIRNWPKNHFLPNRYLPWCYLLNNNRMRTSQWCNDAHWPPPPPPPSPRFFFILKSFFLKCFMNSQKVADSLTSYYECMRVPSSWMYGVIKRSHVVCTVVN